MNQKAKVSVKKEVPVSLLTKNDSILGITNHDNSKSMQGNSKELTIKGNKQDDLSNILKIPLSRVKSGLDTSNSQKSPARILSAKETTNNQGNSKFDDPLSANFKSMKYNNKNYPLNNQD